MQCAKIANLVEIHGKASDLAIDTYLFIYLFIDQSSSQFYLIELNIDA